MRLSSLLGAYDWPGNVRELRHEIARAVIGSRRRPSGPMFLSSSTRDVGSLPGTETLREEVSEERQEDASRPTRTQNNKAEQLRFGWDEADSPDHKIKRLGIRRRITKPRTSPFLSDASDRSRTLQVYSVSSFDIPESAAHG